MKIKNPKELFWLVLRISLGVLFIYASWYKIQSPGAFAQQIYNYKILPVWAINPLALVLPPLQFICGLALIINKGTRGSSFLLMGMMIVFQIAVASALLRGLNISCGCFDTGGESATWWTFGRDSLFLIGTVLLFYRNLRYPVIPAKAGIQSLS